MLPSFAFPAAASVSARALAFAVALASKSSFKSSSFENKYEGANIVTTTAPEQILSALEIVFSRTSNFCVCTVIFAIAVEPHITFVS